MKKETMMKGFLTNCLFILLGSLFIFSVGLSQAHALQDEPALSTICVNAFGDENGNGTQEANEGYIAGVTITVGNSSELAGQAVSTGTDKPVCFENIEPNTPYQVSQLLPNRLEMTTASSTTVTVDAGKTVGIQFGSRLRPVATPVVAGETVPSAGETADSPASDPAPTETASGLLAYSGIAVIILGVALLGGLLFWLLRRQTT